jgi:anti-sigma B factor antagonist
MRLAGDLLPWFRQQRGYQTRIDAILRADMKAHESGERRESSWGTEWSWNCATEDARAYTRQCCGVVAYRSPPPYNLPMPTEPLTIERLSAQAGPRVLCLSGPLTIENLALFQNAIRREENVPIVILDLSEVPYIDSSGLGSLVSAYVTRQKATRRIALSGVNERVLKLFETTKVEPLFLIFPTLDDAITALTTAAEA